MKIYISKSSVNCGSCSFINLVGLKGSKKLEDKLAKTKLYPFKATNYSSFLIWADKFKKDIKIFTASTKLNKKMFDLMFYYENIPKEKQKKYEEEATKFFDKQNKKYKKKISLLKNPIKKLDNLLEKGFRVAVLISDYYLNKKRNPVPHWIVADNKVGELYYFMDSAKGITKLTKIQLKKGLKLNKKIGFLPQLVAYKCF